MTMELFMTDGFRNNKRPFFAEGMATFRNAIPILFFSGVCNFASAQIPGSDELVCGLPDGSEFILRSRHIWYAPIFGHSSGEAGNKPYKVYFRPKDGFRKIETGNQFGYVPLVQGNPNKLCANVAIIDGLAQAGLELFYATGEKLASAKSPDYLWLSGTEKEQPEPYRSQIKKAGLYASASKYTKFTKKNDVIIREDALFRMDEQCGKMPGVPDPCPIGGVFRAESRDWGKTWSVPEVRTTAEIFTLGKSIMEQTFIGRPTEINGKKIEPHFPPESITEK